GHRTDRGGTTLRAAGHGGGRARHRHRGHAGRGPGLPARPGAGRQATGGRGEGTRGGDPPLSRFAPVTASRNTAPSSAPAIRTSAGALSTSAAGNGTNAAAGRYSTSSPAAALAARETGSRPSGNAGAGRRRQRRADQRT